MSSRFMDIQLPYHGFELANGLRVFVHEDHGAPIVSANMWYHVGSANERVGRTGFAHLFEHLMFEGSRHVPEGRFDQLLEAVGASNNGSTNPDRTNYWEDLPSNALELALYLESDRMGWLADTMTQEKLDAQRDVVKNERRQSYENRPYGLAFETILTELYPPHHPYHWPTIGSMADLSAATLDDVLAFFRTYYAPNNAALAIAGDVDTAQVQRQVERYFGEIPRGAPVAAPEAPPAQLAGNCHRTLEDNVQLPRLYLAWHAPAAFAPGDAEMEAVAGVLTEGRSARLYRSLVYDRQVAQSVSAFQDSGRLGSAFYVTVTARPDVPLAGMERAVLDELAAMASNGIRSEEIERVRNNMETAFVDSLQSVGGFGGKADRLNLYNFFVGDAGYAQADLARYDALTAESVAAAGAHYLAHSPYVSLSVVPRGKRALSAEVIA